MVQAPKWEISHKPAKEFAASLVNMNLSPYIPFFTIFMSAAQKRGENTSQKMGHYAWMMTSKCIVEL